MDSSDDDEENAPVTAPAERTADLMETEIKHDDFVEEFLLRMENGDTTWFESTAADDGGVDASAGNEEDALLLPQQQQRQNVLPTRRRPKSRKMTFLMNFIPSCPTLPRHRILLPCLHMLWYR
ncbi:hypothetical protein MHU86_12936 [Fragilaria crotonensis]|nr:hypothetical protein MHU86_12936 [Fragilaria crotonensis]